MVRNLRRLAVALGVLSLCSGAAAAAADIGEIAAEEVARVMPEAGFQAVSLAWVSDDRISTYHFGTLADGSAPSDRTVYDIGSITKTHTGLLLARAVADGLVGLDDAVSDYLPSVDPDRFIRAGQAVTLRHLATHLSGMPTDLACGEPDLAPDDRLACLEAHDRSDLLGRLQSLELLDTPGAQYRYSNAGIRLLGYILEDLHGASFVELVEREVFARTGQVETRFELDADQRTRWQLGRHENGIPTPDASNHFNPGGGLKSTTPDMGRYVRFYLRQDDELAGRAMTLLAGESDGLGRAYVWNTFQLDTEGQLYHSAGTFGTSAWISLYPAEGIGIFLVSPYVSETAQADLNTIANRIVARYREASAMP